MKIVYRDHEETINVSFQARGVVTRPDDEPDFSGDGGNAGDNAGDDAGNGGSNAGNGGSDNQGGSQSPATPTTGEYTIQARVGADGGGSVTIKKNGQLISGDTVMASASDTIELEAIPESDNWQFMSWSDGSSQNPHSFQPRFDNVIDASFLDLSKI